MKVILKQILAGTHIDSQGEKHPKEVLERFAESYKDIKLPLNQHHDLRLPTVGFIENIKVIQDPEHQDTWLLVGDVHIENDEIEIGKSFGGFSISYMEMMRPSSKQESFEVFLPHPHYNDRQLVEQIFEEGHVSVGKIVRKGLSTDEIAIVVSLLVLVVQPAWDDFYRTKIATLVANFFSNRFPILARKNISADVIQHVDYCGHHVQVLLIPLRGHEQKCFSVERQFAAISLVLEYLEALELNHVPVKKVTLTFHMAKGQFQINTIYFVDGASINYT